MKLFYPIAEGIHNQFQHLRVLNIKRSPAAGAVIIVTFVFLLQRIITGIINTAIAQSRPKLVALAGMIKHHIHQDFNTVLVQRFNQLLNLVQIMRVKICLLRGKKAIALVAPVIVFDIAFFMPVAKESVQRQKFYRRNAQPFQIADDNILVHPGKSATLFIRDLRVQFCIAF